MVGYIAEHRQCPKCDGGKTKRQDFAFMGYKVTEDRICRECNATWTTTFELSEKTFHEYEC